MSDRTGGRGRDDSFDLGETKVGVRKGPRGRSLGRIMVATVLVALGGFVAVIDNIWHLSHNLLLEWTGLEIIWAKISVGSAIAWVGYAIYDYRWPFGPRPGVRDKSGLRGFEREVHGSDEY